MKADPSIIILYGRTTTTKKTATGNSENSQSVLSERLHLFPSSCTTVQRDLDSDSEDLGLNFRSAVY